MDQWIFSVGTFWTSDHTLAFLSHPYLCQETIYLFSIIKLSKLLSASKQTTHLQSFYV